MIVTPANGMTVFLCKERAVGNVGVGITAVPKLYLSCFQYVTAYTLAKVARVAGNLTQCVNLRLKFKLIGHFN